MEHSYGQGPGIARRRWISLYRKAASRLERSKRVTLYRDRFEAGRILATQLRAYANRKDVLVLALPRGGVPVAFELARGALATGGMTVINEDVVFRLDIPDDVIVKVAAREQKELERRERLYRDDLPPPDVRDRTVILIDDGLATGSTMRAAVAALSKQRPARIVVAVPVAAPVTCDEFKEVADEIICARTPEPFFGVGYWYEDFSQTSDEEVHDLLALSRQENPLEEANNQ